MDGISGFGHLSDFNWAKASTSPSAKRIVLGSYAQIAQSIENGSDGKQPVSKEEEDEGFFKPYGREKISIKDVLGPFTHREKVPYFAAVV